MSDYEQSFKGKYRFADAHCLEAGLDGFAVHGDAFLFDCLRVDGRVVRIKGGAYGSEGIFESVTMGLKAMAAHARSGSATATIRFGYTSEQTFKAAGRKTSEGLPPRHYRWEVYAAAKQGDADRLRELVALGASVVGRPELNGTDTMLHHAAASGVVDAVRVLLDSGHDPEGPTTRWSPTPLAVATTVPIARLLIAAGAQIDDPEDMAAPAAIALSRGNDAVGRFLLEAGARIPANERERTIVLCAERGQLAVLRLLAQRGPEYTKLFDSAGVMSAAKEGGPVLVDFMLSHGATLPDD